MENSPYSRFECEDLILRDELALERTLLANERTLMTYLRFGIGLLIAGVSMIQFSTQEWYGGVGIACIPLGIVIGMIGVKRYRKMSKSISHLRRGSEMKSKPHETGGS